MAKNKPIAPTRVNQTAAPKAGTAIARIEVDDTAKGFWHRIVHGDSTGQWSGYMGIATLKVGDTVYIACTDYYHGSLPTNVVFKAQTIT